MRFFVESWTDPRFNLGRWFSSRISRTFLHGIHQPARELRVRNFLTAFSMSCTNCCNCGSESRLLAPRQPSYANTVENSICPSPRQPRLHDGTGEAPRLLLSLFRFSRSTEQTNVGIRPPLLTDLVATESNPVDAYGAQRCTACRCVTLPRGSLSLFPWTEPRRTVGRSCSDP